MLRDELFTPKDPALFGLTRMLFGFLMTLDCFVERGLHYADQRWSDQGCRFPLFNGLKQMDANVMIILQFIQALGALSIFIGFRVKLTGWCFVLPYWYAFLLDKTHWNNHSYLFGLSGLMFTLTDSDRAFAVSANNKTIQNWNYLIIRFQIFILYFFAGLKKTEEDWLLGYSMGRLSKHWAFDPFRAMGLSNEFIDRYIVHLSGFMIDLLVGPMLLFDKTRVFAIFALTSFHSMNSQMFSIGMFSYVCLATMWIFCRPNSPKTLFRRIPILKNIVVASPAVKSEERSNWRVNFFLVYTAIQVFLPYSHFITEGYNGWTQGAYGYSWDMMIHSFQEQHVKISYKDRRTGEVGYLKPNAFLGYARKRWTMHPDMLKQYADCVHQRLEASNITDPELYFDVWKSMNQRFVQRVYDPAIDIAHYTWSPFEKPKYALPLLQDLSDWREKLKEMKKEIQDDEIDISFIADFPGLSLENYLAPDLDNTTVELLGGEIEINFDDQANEETDVVPKYIPEIGERVKLPAGEFHSIKVVSDEPAVYMYIYQNSTDLTVRKAYKALSEIDDHLANERPLPDNLTSYFTAEDELKWRQYFFPNQNINEQHNSRKEAVVEYRKSFYARALAWLDKKSRNVYKGMMVVSYAFTDLLAGDDVFADEVRYIERQMEMDAWRSTFHELYRFQLEKITDQKSEQLSNDKDEL